MILTDWWYAAIAIFAVMATPGPAMLLGLAVGICAQEKPTAFTGARILPIAGAPIEDGVLLVQNGKIVAVGDERPAAVVLNWMSSLKP